MSARRSAPAAAAAPLLLLLAVGGPLAQATELTDAIASQTEAECMKVIDSGVDVTEDAGGYQAIHYAANKGYTKLINRMISEGASINALDATQQTALSHAAYAGHPETVTYLLDRGSQLNRQDITGRTALYNAASMGHEEVVRLLMSFGADAKLGLTGQGGAMDMRDSKEKTAEGKTPLLEAMKKGHKSIVKLLKEGLTKPNQAKDEV